MSGMKTAQNIQNPWSSYVTGPISRAIGMKSDALGLQDSQSPSYDVGLVEPGLRGPGMTPQDMLSRMGVTMSDVLGLTNPQETEVENLEPITAIGQPDSSTARTSLDTLNDALGLSGVNSLAGTQARDAYNRSGSATSPSDNVGGSYGANDPSNPSTSNEGPLGGPSLGGWGGFGSTDRDRGGSSSGGYGGNSRGGSDGTGR